MKDSIRLGQVRGITLRIHYTALLFLGALLLVPGPTTLLALGYIFVLGPIVLLHELGHSLVAQHFGIRVLDITFWPLGGMARMNQIPENSRIEGWIAIAGPLVNLALAAVSLPFALVPGPLGRVLLTFAAVNLVLGAFNLLPAFPMDGGRVLRAWLGRRGDWLGATERAVHVGRIVAAAMVIGGFAFGNPVLALVGVFVWWMGGQELQAVRIRHLGRSGWSFGPLRAFFGRRAAEEPRSPTQEPEPPAARAASEAAAAEEASRARRPSSNAQGARSGWSHEDLERLERFPGSLRQFRSEQ